MTEQRISIRIIKTPLPQAINGLSMKDGNTFIVLINENDSQDEQKETFIHEMLHIWHGDHDREFKDVQQLEEQRHQETTWILERQKVKSERVKA